MDHGEWFLFVTAAAAGRVKVLEFYEPKNYALNKFQEQISKTKRRIVERERKRTRANEIDDSADGLGLGLFCFFFSV